ncbi:hypothetical protein [Paenibacillus humicola]|uniref:hypothetical protein n=1 Tax=Paenibacillus humicola TaxID=3110540 RepID=UPI00237B8775|nr:hypothetical protein [Paenibacillus humicola]
MNGFPIIVIGVVVVLLVGFLLWRRKQQAWSVVYEGPELTEKASDQLAILQDNGIRCRVRNKPMHSGANSGIANTAIAEPVDVRIIIEIHQDDISKARRLLEQRVSGRFEFHLSS